VFAPAQRREPQLNWRMFRYEEPLWQLVTARPEHLLNPQFEDWNGLLLAAADAVIADLEREKLAPAAATWGRRNTAAIRHPLAQFLSRWLTGWLDLPADPLPGDTYTPRAQSPRFGASNRLVVSPGREEQGFLHMPGGQSGHPLSPFYRAGHAAWVRGEPTPFLPGPAQHTLSLTPGQN
jgi:penicillin amidase